MMQVLNYKLPLAKLDMRCWTGPDMDIPLPSKVRSCLEHFAASTAQELQAEYNMVRVEFAESLQGRAKVLHTHCCKIVLLLSSLTNLELRGGKHHTIWMNSLVYGRTTALSNAGCQEQHTGQRSMFQHVTFAHLDQLSLLACSGCV